LPWRDLKHANGVQRLDPLGEFELAWQSAGFVVYPLPLKQGLYRTREWVKLGDLDIFKHQ
jgi:hypothetical protein